MKVLLVAFNTSLRPVQLAAKRRRLAAALRGHGIELQGLARRREYRRGPRNAKNRRARADPSGRNRIQGAPGDGNISGV